MRVTTLQWHGNFKIEVSDTEMSALRKIVEAGLFALEGDMADGVDNLTTSEKKAMAYWKGQNPLNNVDSPAKPHRRPRTGAKAKEAVG